jgi:hypothetical protein
VVELDIAIVGSSIVNSLHDEEQLHFREREKATGSLLYNTRGRRY